MTERKLEPNDIVMIDQGDSTVHAYRVIELSDGTRVWRDLGVMQLQHNGQAIDPGK